MFLLFKLLFLPCDCFFIRKKIVGFDCVDDESRPEGGAAGGGLNLSSIPRLPFPSSWTGPENPPYHYWMYFLYANIASLNALRASKVKIISFFSASFFHIVLINKLIKCSAPCFCTHVLL